MRGVEPLKISLVDAVERIQRAALNFPSASTRELPYLYRELLDEIARCHLPERRHRSYPRAVKVKMSSLPKKRSSLQQAKRAS